MNIALIGVGRIGFSLERDKLRKKPCTHLGAILRLQKENYSIKKFILCDTDKHKTTDAAEYIKNEIPNIEIKETGDYKKAISYRPDLVIIASNTETHFRILKTSIKAGIKKVVVEKPIVMKKTHAEKIERLTKNSSSRVWVNYERRYHPKYINLKSQIDSQEPYGAPLYYRGWFSTSQKNLVVHKNKEGILLHDTTHLLDLIFYLFGPPASKIKRLIGGKKNNPAHILHVVHEKTEGQITTVGGIPYFHFELEILFEHGRIRIGNGFHYMEEKIESPHYEGFVSLDEMEKLEEQSEDIFDNPFIRLYLNVYKDRHESSFLKDACQNIFALLR